PHRRRQAGEEKEAERSLGGRYARDKRAKATAKCPSVADRQSRRPVEGPAAPVDAPLPSVEAGEEPEFAAGTEADEGGRDDESDDDEAASESHSSPVFTAIDTPSRPSAGRWAGGNPSPETPLAARRHGDSPPLELAFRYKVRRNGVDESAALLLPVSVVRGKHVAMNTPHGEYFSVLRHSGVSWCTNWPGTPGRQPGTEQGCEFV
ncbi:hypothetical protein KEM55_007140, partial [Ascosphaera atra]